jgi:hypothetical protein
MFVQFSDETEKKIISVFGCLQDENVWPNQGEVDENDPRYIAFQDISSSGGKVETLIANTRYEHETAGIIYQGMAVGTTRDDRATLTDMALAVVLDPAYVCNLKTSEGFVVLNAAQLLAVSAAVRSYVQSCFDRELELLQAVKAGEYHVEMLTKGWPDPLSPENVSGSAEPQ